MFIGKRCKTMDPRLTLPHADITTNKRQKINELYYPIRKLLQNKHMNNSFDINKEN